MSYFEKFEVFFNAYKCSGHKELELKLLIDPRNKFPNFIERIELNEAIKLSKSVLDRIIKNGETSTTSQTINFISNQGNYQSHIKELYFDAGVQVKEKKRIYTKESVHSPIFLGGAQSTSKFPLKLSFNVETDSVEDVINFDLIRFKHRFSFQIKHWRADVTFIKVSYSKEISIIREIKEKLFMSKTNEANLLTEDWLWEFCDKIEIEFEYNSAEEFTIGFIQEIYNVIDLGSSSCVRKDILQIVDNLINGNSRQSKTQKNTIKKILPNAIEINKKQYLTEILPNIENFYLTDKADGTRTILYLDQHSAYYYDKEYCDVEYKSEYDTFCYEATIIECERINDKFYAYDIIQFNGVNVSNVTFDKRLNYLHRVQWPHLIVKKFVKLTKETYQRDIRTFYEHCVSSTDYGTDGIIFTSCNSAYRTTEFYKWKPVHDMTIDFVVKKCPKELLGISPYVVKEGYNLYLLFAGISLKDAKKMNISRIQHYGKLFPLVDKHYFPIQFTPSDCPGAYMWYCADQDLDGKVCEFNYCDGWILKKIREDRAHDFKKKNYYGNNFKVAEIIWRNFRNPLTLDLLCSSYGDIVKNFYFVVDRAVLYEGIRKFNNHVKQALFNKFLFDGKLIVDLGCGKGQDLFKYIRMKAKNVLMIDSNENNLCEVIARKYNFCDSKAFDKDTMGIFVQNLDLTQNYLENLVKIETCGIPFAANQAHLVVCNFAIHYLIDDERQIDNLVNMVDALLAPGGRFIFTCLDGEKIFNLLKGDVSEWGDGTKYKIKKLYDAKKFVGTGQQIDILLPFSGGELYTESLVNLKMLKKHFSKKKIKLESQDTFEVFLNSFKGTGLDDLDMEYMKLLSFSIYYKR
jgi:SAM-dependent methyltransferase